jgi:hypothetical protein
MKFPLSLLLTEGGERIKILDGCGLEGSVSSKTGSILLIQTKLKMEIKTSRPKFDLSDIEISVYGKRPSETPIHTDALKEHCQISVQPAKCLKTTFMMKWHNFTIKDILLQVLNHIVFHVCALNPCFTICYFFHQKILLM